MANELVKVTGLWKGQTRDGKEMLSGNLSGSARVVIFENSYKEQDGEKAPDFIMYISPNEKRDEKPEPESEFKG